MSGSPFAYQASATDQDGDQIFYSLIPTQGAPPPSPPLWIGIDTNTGLITATPPGGATSTSSVTITVQARDARGALSAPKWFTITISPQSFANHDPHFTSPLPPNAAVATVLYRYTVTASDPDSDPLTFDLPVHPDGMTIDPVRGIIVWRPTEAQAANHLTGQSGDYTGLVRVQDGRGGVDLQSFTVHVTTSNVPPVVISKPPLTTVASVPYQYQVLALDSDDTTLSYSVSSVPAVVNLSISSSGLLTWPNPVLQAGELQSVYSIVIHVSDGPNDVIQSYSLTVFSSSIAPTNHAPVFTSQWRTTAQADVDYAYWAQATDPDGDQVMYWPTGTPILLGSLGNLGPVYTSADWPAGVSIFPYSGLVHWKPTTDQIGGPYPFTIVANDGRGGLASQTVSISVVMQITNHAPVITSTPVQTAVVGRLYEYDLTATDEDHDPILWQIMQGPPEMQIDPIRGTLLWVPTEAEVGGNDIAVQATDPYGLYDGQGFTITVHGVNRPPQIRSTPPTQAVVGHFYSYAVVASDPDGDSIFYTASITPLDAGLPTPSITIDSNTGLLTCLPTAAGSYSVTITARDPSGLYDQQPYTLVVSTSAVGPPIVTATSPQYTATGVAYSYPVSASDPQGETLSYSLTYSPLTTNGPGISSTGLITWDSPVEGLYTITVTATNTDNLSGQASYQLLVRTNHEPTLSVTSQTVIAGRNFVYAVPASDPDHDVLTYSLTGAPAGMSIDHNGQISWQTSASNVGTYTIGVTATDPFGATNQPHPAYFTLSVVVDAPTHRRTQDPPLRHRQPIRHRHLLCPRE
jgi:hypothetical protein